MRVRRIGFTTVLTWFDGFTTNDPQLTNPPFALDLPKRGETGLRPVLGAPL
ncbi:MAG: hypothetical protein HYT87_16795 [Nitrospirae bacterium]|nr:hypothetical protein [Nitrospirota bacterium]